MKKLWRLASFWLMFVVLPSLANYTCYGEVKGVSIEARTGHLIVENIGPLEWPRLCSVDRDYNSISPEACRVVYSTLITAQTTQKSVIMWFNDGKDCSRESHQPWKVLTGWYFGPKLHD
ncbi:hypothetical protein AAOGI_41490 [Agarivorans albus]